MNTVAKAEPCPASDYGQLLDTHGNDFKLPDFTIKQIRDAIPAHCFERSALRGYLYIARDVLFLATTFYLFTKYNTPDYVSFVSICSLGVFSFRFLEDLNTRYFAKYVD